MNNQESRIGNFTIIAMMTVAITIDLIGLFLVILGIGLVLNRVIAFIGWFIYIFWFYFKGVNLLNLNGKNTTRRLAASASGVIVEAIPLLGVLPGFSISIGAIIAMTRFEDKTGISVAKTESVTKGRILNREKQRVLARQGSKSTRQESGQVKSLEKATA